LINFLVYFDRCIVFLKFVDAFIKKREHKYLFGLLVDMIEELGSSNVVQVFIDDRTNFKKVG
jgi:hypothetical protein